MSVIRYLNDLEGTVSFTLKFGPVEGGVNSPFVLVYAALLPTDDEWRTHLESRIEYSRSVRAVRCLVVTGESAPSPRQRLMLEAAMRPFHSNMRVAVAASSTFVRGVVAAFQRVHSGYRAFEHRELDSALSYLEVSPNRFSAIRRQIDEWRMVLALPPLPALPSPAPSLSSPSLVPPSLVPAR